MDKNPESRIVKRTKLLGGTVTVSTVFLGIDHGIFGNIPILFETMIFGGISDQAQWRYHTWDEAVESHDQAVEEINLVLCN